MTATKESAANPSRVLEKAIDALKCAELELPLEEVDRALESVPDDFRLWHVKGLIHRQEEQRERAIPALRRAAELAPDVPLIAHGYARTLLEAGLESVEPFSRALKLSPGDPDVVQGLAASLVAERRIDEAIEGLERVLRRSPLWTDGHILLADLRWRNGDGSRFTRSFVEALGDYPNSLDLRREHMNALLHAEHYGRVLEQVIEGRALFGRHPLFTSFEAVVRSERGTTEEADALFAEIPSFTDASSDVRLVRHLLRSDRAREALPILDAWLKSDEQAMFWPSAATAWRMTGDPRAEWLEGVERIVGIYDIVDQLPPLDRIAEILKGLHNVCAQPLSQSVRGGTQTDGNLFHRIEPEIVTLREAVRQTVAKHVLGLPVLDLGHPLGRGRPEKIKFSGAWSVRLGGGGKHVNHVHPSGWLSSALYITLPENYGDGESAGWLCLGEPDAQLGTGLLPRRMVEPKSGRLVLFPSWMWHGTLPFRRGERLTIAFDVAPKH
jgi:tetratricopeptide (TPR) repeat protein